HKGYIFNSEFNLRCEIHKSLSYGLDVTQEKAYFGTQAGKTIIFDLKDDKKQTIQIHNQGIDGLKCQDTLLYTASNDSTLKITDLRTEKQIRTIQNDSDINSVDVKDHFFIFGDNNGILYHCDLRNEKIKEEIKWHNSAINSVYFATDSIFASVSDEQVALFDTNLVEEEGWTAHHWLWFVHRGQKFYKEICVLEDKWAVTSADGIAIFKPVEALDDDLEESESEE
ncbi:Ribosome Assembly protein, partial [Pseudoloma neurophilia]